jgi:hypothetical protein
MLLVAVGKNIGTLDNLREEAKDVVYDEDGSVGIGRSSNIWYSLDQELEVHFGL